VKPDKGRRHAQGSELPAEKAKEPVSQPATEVKLTEGAKQTFLSLRQSNPVRFEKVKKALITLAENPRHPGLRSYHYRGKAGPGGEKLWESYVENHAPAAYRLFWFYGPSEGIITVLAITPHP
jgi:hypothetical protein